MPKTISKERKRGYKFERIVHKNQGQGGSVTVGSKFTALERSAWHRVQDFVQENFAIANPNRKREEIAMIILDAAMKTLGIVVEIPESAQEARNDNQLNIPGTDEVPGVEQGEDDSENLDAPLNQEEDLEDYDANPEPPNPHDVDEPSSYQVEEGEDSDDVLPLDETG